MIKSTYSKYPDVSVTTHTKYGLIVSKTFRIIKNEERVKDRIRVMCLDHDLKYFDISSTCDENSCICCLKYFESLLDADLYIKQKAGKTNYSIMVKNEFIKAKIGDKTYIYRFNTNNTQKK